MKGVLAGSALLVLLVVGGVSASWLDVEEPDPLAVAGGSSAGQCYKAVCRQRDQSCTGAGDVCTAPFACGSSGVCAQAASLGGECGGDTDCNTNDFVISNRYCYNGECSELSREGYSCQNSKRCLSALVCIDGVCRSDGLVVDEDCSNSSCRSPLVCDATASPPRCTARADEGGNCSAAVPCGLGLDCVDGACVAQYSRDEGEACGERTCMAPLVCGTTTHTCVRTFSPTTIRQRVCSTDTDCPDDCTCECDWGSGTRRCTIAKAPSSSALVLYNEMLSCIKSNDYSREPCTTKVVAWVQASRTTETTGTAELYCMLGLGTGATPSAVAVLAVVLLAVAGVVMATRA